MWKSTMEGSKFPMENYFYGHQNVKIYFDYTTHDERNKLKRIGTFTLDGGYKNS